MAAASRMTETPCSKEMGKTETCGLDEASAPQMYPPFGWQFNLVNVESPLPTPTGFLVTRASQQSQGFLASATVTTATKHGGAAGPRGGHRQPRDCTHLGRVCRIAATVTF